MQVYRDILTLKLAGEINDFVRSKTSDSTIALVALSAAKETLSFVSVCEDQQPSDQESSELLPTSE